MAKTIKVKKQYAALPMRRFGSRHKVLLLTSRDTGRWVVPKGWPIRHLAPWQTAAIEAFEEAGLRGRVKKKPLGAYTYNKRRRKKQSVRCSVKVYLMLVDEVLKKWPEAHERKRDWFDPKKAAKRVNEPELKMILRDVANQLSASKG